ncbi:putative exonuclease V, mitochondrial [Grifola frondosa]|uniref:Putative exonuclease V, mitochondrial n=1 Tax=Grifola frondosa TaxID=5627 RepID=A0A1C7MRZ0_GRIFR|nr:putative exonuclease V, mitochondrial [Grifola frondosa]
MRTISPLTSKTSSLPSLRSNLWNRRAQPYIRPDRRFLQTTSSPYTTSPSSPPKTSHTSTRSWRRLQAEPELEPPPLPEDPARPFNERSPFERFRRWKGTLSVSDLVGPSWCEVQFDYEGKTIAVVKAVAVVNDETTTRGKSVHKILEREIHPETMPVDITTPEERWAIRIVNMLSCLQALMEVGCCREIPVFGIIHDQVSRVSLTSFPNKRAISTTASSTPSKPKSKRSRRTPSPSQPQITSFFPSTPGRSHTPPLQNLPLESIPHYRLHLSDTKTRRSKSLPSDEDTLQARLQLMLYHRLLSNLLVCQAGSEPYTGPIQPMDFDTLWTRMALNPFRPFSDKFMEQAGLDVSSAPSASPLRCLNDLTAAWRHAVQALDVDGVDGTLTLVYRMQPMRGSRWKGKEKATSEDLVANRATAPPPGVLSEQEAQEIATAIQASVNNFSLDDGYDGDDGDEGLARAIFESLKESIRTGHTAVGELGFLAAPTAATAEPSLEEADIPPGDPELALAQQQSLLAEAAEDVEAAKLVPQEQEEPQKDDADDEPMSMADLDVKARILGKKEFAVDDAFLDEYLDSVLLWWLGRRPPHGVDIEQTRRCLSCEYQNGCEWREMKADEAIRKFKEERALASVD